MFLGYGMKLEHLEETNAVTKRMGELNIDSFRCLERASAHGA